MKEVNKEIGSNKDMAGVLTEHMKSVEEQVSHKQMIFDETNKQIDLEKHTIQLIERQIGKISADKIRKEQE